MESSTAAQRRLSIIIPCFNAASTINRAVTSIFTDNILSNEIEVIIIDDKSTDDSLKIINELQGDHPEIVLITRENNSGKPSIPRNQALDIAKGKYISFLDADDYLDAHSLNQMLCYSEQHNLDFLKGWLYVVKRDAIPTNKIKGDHPTVRDVISQQSTTIDLLLRNEFVQKNQIRFPENIRIGEDTIFYAEIIKNLPKFEYIDSAFYYYTKDDYSSEISVTHEYNDDNLQNHLYVWNEAEKHLRGVGESYFSLRLQVAIKNTLNSIIKFSHNKISDTVFHKFALFVRANKQYIDPMFFTKRIQELYSTLLADDYAAFSQHSKRRLLVAGYDLKFIAPYLETLKEDYLVMIDEWSGHNMHNEQQSLEYLNSADIIWAEWLLGNAVWYAKHKQKNQILIVRAHGFELFREFGHEIEVEKIDALICVGYYYLNQFRDRFQFDHSKMHLLANYVEADKFSDKKSEDCLYNLALVGAIPRNKGLMKALHILHKLLQRSTKYKLHVYGKKVEEVSWVHRDHAEQEYFSNCSKFINDNKLVDSVIYHGWTEREKMFENIGFVLSLSEQESFHLSPLEGACARSMPMVLTDWPGSEYIYPTESLYSSIEEITDKILYYSERPDEFHKVTESLASFVRTHYDIKKFSIDVETLIGRLMKS